MNEGNSGVYRILNLQTNKQYIGSAVHIRNRWNKHKTTMRRGCHHTPTIQNAYNKYGMDALSFSVILVCRPEDLILYEQIIIDAFKPEYNIRSYARSNLGVKYSAESCARLSDALKGNKNTLGYRHTPEARANMSAAKKGHQKGMTGKQHSPETRAKIAAGNMGKRHTPEGRARISAGKKGKPISAATLAARLQRYALRRLMKNALSA